MKCLPLRDSPLSCVFPTPYNQRLSTQLLTIFQLLNTNITFLKQKWHVLQICSMLQHRQLNYQSHTCHDCEMLIWLTFVDLNCQKCHRSNLNTVGVHHGGVDNRKGVDNCMNCIKAWKKEVNFVVNTIWSFKSEICNTPRPHSKKLAPVTSQTSYFIKGFILFYVNPYHIMTLQVCCC